MSAASDPKPNDPPAAPSAHPAGDPAAVPPEPLSDRAMRQIALLLGRADGRQAVRAYLQFLAHEASPSEAAQRHWVVARIGKEAAGQLISAMAAYPCFSCDSGRESCPVCGGSGFTAVAKVCAACIGLGTGRCDFCNGTGLATYNLLPQDFRAAVAIKRSHRAERALGKLLAGIQTAGGAAPGGDETQLIHGLNKLLGVLENASLTARQLVREGMADEQWSRDVDDACAAPASAALEALSASLGRLAPQHREAATQAGQQDPIAAEEAISRAEFIEDLLATGRFQGTLLHHMFLPGLAPYRKSSS